MLWCILPVVVPAQDSLVIGTILCEGNNRTRRAVLLREMTFREGQSLPAVQLPAEMKESRRLLGNTGLFLKTRVDTCHLRRDTVDVCIRVKEAWYIYPIPIFELADRNFNVWWEDFYRDPNRINFGLYINHYNLTGWGDLLKAKVQYGYAHKYELAYNLPQIPGHPAWGIGILAQFQQYREINYASANDRQLFYRDFNRWMLRKSAFQIHLRYRPNYVWKFSSGISFRDIVTDPQVADELNPNFFPMAGSEMAFLTLWAHAEKDRLDDRPYAFRGHALSIDMVKEGLGITGQRDKWWVEGQVAGYLPTGSFHGFEAIVSGRVQLNRANPGFFEYNALGYGLRLVRGYEHYVVDGMDYALIQAAWRIRILDRDIPLPWPSWFTIPAFQALPLKIYLQAMTDHGIVHDPFFRANNPLRDRWLMSAGLGIDLRFFFDKIFTLRWNVNGLGENGLFLQTSFSIR